MNKTIEALLRGYLLFDVNGKRFLRYNSALAERKSIEGDVYFEGFHVLKGWTGFFYRVKS
jgi:hypothetical protein